MSNCPQDLAINEQHIWISKKTLEFSLALLTRLYQRHLKQCLVTEVITNIPETLKQSISIKRCKLL